MYEGPAFEVACIANTKLKNMQTQRCKITSDVHLVNFRRHSATIIHQAIFDSAMANKHPSGIRVGHLELVEDRFKCGHCKLVLRDPVQSAECGHRYCRACIDTMSPIDCIACKEEGEDSVPHLSLNSVRPDAAIVREMNAVKFDCPWNPCVKILSLADLIQHAAYECEHREVACDWCGEFLLHSILESHKESVCPKRLMQCTDCKESVVAELMSHHRDTECPGSTRQCESCTARVKDTDEAMKKHVTSDCPVGWADGRPCPFGCGIVEDAATHRAEFLALHLDRLHIGVTAESAAAQTTDDSPSATSGGTKYETAAASGAAAMSQEPDTPESILLVADEAISTAELLDCILSYGLPHMPKQTRDTQGQITFFDRYEAAFKVSRDLQRFHLDMAKRLETSYRVMDPLLEQKTREYEELSKAADMYSEFLRAMSLKEVRICDLERSIALQELGSTDGTLVWKIAFCKERMTDTEYEAVVFSPILFTEKFGYKLAAVAHLNGHGSGRGSHLSVQVRLLQGPYDSALRWPFRRTVIITLIDQVSSSHLVKEYRPDASSQFQRPSQTMGQPFGFEQFALKDDLEAKGFLKDDVMFLKVQVSKPTLTPGDF